MALFGLFKRRRTEEKRFAEKTCADCSNFIWEKKHLDFVDGGYLTIMKSSCKIYGEFNTLQSGNLNNKVIGKSESYRSYRMTLIEKARECNDFNSEHDADPIDR